MRERARRGEGSTCKILQSFAMKELVKDKQNEVYIPYDIEIANGGYPTEYCLCQGKVIEILQRRN